MAKRRDCKKPLVRPAIADLHPSGFADGTAHSLEQISRLYGRSREGIRQLEIRALNKLRRNAATKALQEFLS